MKLQQWPERLPGIATTIQLQPDQYAAHLDIANLLILGRQYNDAKEHLDLLVQKQPNNPDVYIARSNYYSAPTTPPPLWRTCKRLCNWIPTAPTLI